MIRQFEKFLCNIHKLSSLNLTSNCLLKKTRLNLMHTKNLFFDTIVQFKLNKKLEILGAS